MSSVQEAPRAVAEPANGQTVSPELRPTATNHNSAIAQRTNIRNGHRMRSSSGRRSGSPMANTDVVIFALAFIAVVRIESSVL